MAVLVSPNVQAQSVPSPRVPANLQVPAELAPFLLGHAEGTQNYICMPSASGMSWTFFGPQATLFNGGDQQLTTHYLSANPFENETPRATWQHSADTSRVWAMAVASSSDSAYVASGAIPWLLLQVVGAEDGPHPSDSPKSLKTARYIHRVNTVGGLAPATGCSAAGDVGRRALVRYEADYVFYEVPEH